MYCYFCGEKIDENKLGLVTNKSILAGEIDNLKVVLNKENDKFYSTLFSYRKDRSDGIKNSKEKYKSTISKARADLRANLINKEQLVLINGDAKVLLNEQITNIDVTFEKRVADLKIEHQQKVKELKDKILDKKGKLQSVEGSDNYLDKASLEASVKYICPRCGHLVHEGYTKEEIKSLSAACHAELQRGRNDFARGMSSLSISIILLITGIIFLLLSRKADIQNQISTSCPEFWVFLILSITSFILIVLGTRLVIRGVNRKSRYTSLLKDINTGTFVQ